MSDCSAAQLKPRPLMSRDVGLWEKISWIQIHTVRSHRSFFSLPGSLELARTVWLIVAMSDSKSCTIRTRRFLGNRLLQRRQFVSIGTSRSRIAVSRGAASRS